MVRVTFRMLVAVAVVGLGGGGAVEAESLAAECRSVAISSERAPAWYATECLGTSLRELDESLGVLDKASVDGLAYALHIWLGTGNPFISHEIDDFFAQTVHGSNPAFISALAFDPTATTLYAMNSDTDQLGTMNLANGAFTAIGTSTPAPGQATWGGLAFDPTDGTLYAVTSSCDSSALYTLDSATGVATHIGTDFTAQCLVDLAISCDGTLYAQDVVTDSLYTLDKATGEATLVGPLGFDINFSQGMDFDRETGVLHAWMNDNFGSGSYGVIDTSTGAFTALQAMGDSNQEWEGATRTTCSPLIFADGFETGDTSAW